MEDKHQAEVRRSLIADVRGYTRHTQEHGDEATGALPAKFAEIAGGAVTVLIDLVSERVGSYQRSPQLGVLLGKLWVE